MIINEVEEAKAILEREEVIAIPTETVYGLAGNIFSEKAIKKIFELKKRPFFNPLIVHIQSIDNLVEVASEIPAVALKLAEAFWPGPLTLILPKKENISDLISGGKKTVGIRVPNHPQTLKLLEILNFPVAAPSANTFQSLSPTTPEHVAKNFGDALPILEGGACKLGLESTIVGFDGEQVFIYRLGAISVEEIEKIAGKTNLVNQENKQPVAPGMLHKHYAPKTKIIVTSDLKSEILRCKDLKIGVLQLQKQVDKTLVFKAITLSQRGDLMEAGQNFYKALHELDSLKLDLIIVEKMPDEGMGKTMNDRLSRAIA